MDFIVDQYFPVLDALQSELDELEEHIFSGKYVRSVTSRIYHLRRDLLSLKQAVTPLLDVSSHLTRIDSDLIPADTRPYFQDVHDHVIRIADLIDNLQELSQTALDANLALISVSQNDDTKRLAAWAAILAVPTMIAGVYGMNFEVHARNQMGLRLSRCDGRHVPHVRPALSLVPQIGLAVGNC